MEKCFTLRTPSKPTWVFIRYVMHRLFENRHSKSPAERTACFRVFYAFNYVQLRSREQLIAQR